MDYTRLRKDDDEEFVYSKTTPPTQPPQGRPYRSNATLLSSLALTISIITGIFTLIAYINGPRNLKPQSPDSLFRCGTSAAQAKAAGCHFDLMSFSWLPSACYNEDLTNDFLNYTDWKWSLDIEGRHLVPKEYVQQGDFEYLFTSYEYHVVHCVFMWKKTHQAILDGSFDHLDGYIAGLGHTGHCGEMLLDRGTDLKTWGTPGWTKFPACGRGVLNLEQGWYRMHNGEKAWGMPGAGGHHHN
ncbi:uncharacterized protein NFIA_001230 [Aspergillus fischeri NRRL 181]|uniref:Uncharacterized protein n=1 Tax=Neosartorya fischeri (strain ATCC 1020 / DSM 3700 / CBS 544.65 / FGSC A1164 / JCM 1740 / NRRL 181 / WB 181) TaxID=331117 RepID=A1DJ87_NEOFI|nr:conserved hypothetical protein [Aspergillus fischeri NRRL 181]EAW16776.1 conserved hypothetical protein [Aspergillus fischeri NRRL 181]